MPSATCLLACSLCHFAPPFPPFSPRLDIAHPWRIGQAGYQESQLLYVVWPAAPVQYCIWLAVPVCVWLTMPVYVAGCASSCVWPMPSVYCGWQCQFMCVASSTSLSVQQCQFVWACVCVCTGYIARVSGVMCAINFCGARGGLGSMIGTRGCMQYWIGECNM